MTRNKSKQAADNVKYERELKRWQNVKSKPLPRHYFAILIVVLSVIYIVDEVTSNMTYSMQSYIVFDLFHIGSRDVNSPEYASAMNKFAFVSACSIIFSLIVPFYKALADKLGRRLFLAINTVGMALGMLVVMIAPNPVVYGIGYAMILFVIPNDVQVMYIMEVAPAKHRAKLCTITKAIALASVSSIGILRSAFMTDAPSSWRLVFIIPVVVAAVVGIMSVFFVRETPVFLDERMAYLESKLKEPKTINTEDKENNKDDKSKTGINKETQKSGVLNAMRFIKKHKQLKYIAICAVLVGLSTSGTQYYETIMAGSMSVADISKAIIFFPLANSVVTFVSGFLADKLGRKKAATVLGIVAMLGLITFIFSAKFGFGAVITGIAFGVFIGGLWSANDIVIIMLPQESTPTEIRASVTGAVFLFSYVGIFLSTVIVIVLQNFLDMGYLCLGVSVPAMMAAIILMLIKVHETDGTDLATVTGYEYD